MQQKVSGCRARRGRPPPGRKCCRDGVVPQQVAVALERTQAARIRLLTTGPSAGELSGPVPTAQRHGARLHFRTFWKNHRWAGRDRTPRSPETFTTVLGSGPAVDQCDRGGRQREALATCIAGAHCSARWGRSIGPEFRRRRMPLDSRNPQASKRPAMTCPQRRNNAPLLPHGHAGRRANSPSDRSRDKLPKKKLRRCPSSSSGSVGRRHG
jgi:hypothetical protein